MIEKADQFVSFKFEDVQLLDILNFLGETASLDSLLEAYNAAETKNNCPDERFDDSEKLKNTQFPPYENFFSKLCNKSPVEKHYSDLKI